MKETHVHEVVVAGDDDHLEIAETVKEALRLAELRGIALGGEVARHDDEIRLQFDDFFDGVTQQLTVEHGVPTVDVRNLSDLHLALRPGRTSALVALHGAIIGWANGTSLVPAKGAEWSRSTF